MGVWCCVGPGCLLPRQISGRRAACPPARRPRRELRLEWSLSRPALALPPPTGTAAWPPAPSTPVGRGVLTGGSARRLVVRPGPATAHGRRSLVPLPPTGAAARPSGALHTCGAWRADGSFGASFQRPARPRRRLIDFARNSSMTHSNIEFASLELQCFWGVSKNDHDKLRAKCGGGGVVAARGYRSLASPLPVGITGVSRVEFLGRSGACCYKRRQSKAFFVWISDPLLQTSSIRGLFR